MIYRFGAHELDTDVFELRRAGVPVPIEPQVFNVLTYLVEHRERVVTKHELLDNVWGDRFVSESALTTRVKAARRAVGDDGQQQRVIRTLHGRGYRFVAEVDDGDAETASAPAPVAPAVPGWPLVGRAAELEELAAWFGAGDTGGVLLTGGAGLGKTRIAEECLRLAVDAGLTVARAHGHPEARSIPFAALAHLLPGDVATAISADGELDRAGVFHRARAALRDWAGDARLLLLIDDADQLDELSRALLASLVQSRTVFAVLTMRTAGGATSTTPFDHLVKDGHLRRLEITPLQPESVETLLHRVLGGPLVAGSVRRLVESATGNPGVLRQLVDAALEDGTLTEHDGVWRLTGPLRPTPSLESLVDERLRGLDDAHRHAAELLAIAGEVALDAVRPIAGDRVLEDLERRGMLTVRQSGRRVDVSLPHPLFGEVLLRDLPELRSRRLRRELADTIEGAGARRRDDRVRLVAWRLDGGGEVKPALVLDAARFALLDGDLDTAERLIRRAEADGAGVEAVQLLAELHFRRNEPALVEETLAGIDLTQLRETERARVVRRRSGNRFYGLTDPPGALTVIDEAEHLFTEEEPRRAVQAQRAIILSMTGEVGAALAVTSDLGTGCDSSRFEALRARAVALAAAGRGEGALELVEEGRALHARFDPDLARPGRTILLFAELLALTELGRLDEARELARRAAAEGPAGGRVAWLAFAVPRIELTTGNPVAALRAAQPYAIEARARGAFGAERWVLALAGMARLLGGDLEGGARDVERVRMLWPQPAGLFRSDRDRAFGWLAAEQGDLPAAREMLLAAARDAGARGAYALEAMLLHDVVRFGGAAAAADRLVELAGAVQGELMQLRAAHAGGIVAADVGRLRRTVDGFDAIGSPLLAAEAAVDLAVACRSHGDRAGAAEATAQARTLRGKLDGAVSTVDLVDLDSLGDQVRAQRTAR